MAPSIDDIPVQPQPTRSVACHTAAASRLHSEQTFVLQQLHAATPIMNCSFATSRRCVHCKLRTLRTDNPAPLSMLCCGVVTHGRCKRPPWSGSYHLSNIGGVMGGVVEFGAGTETGQDRDWAMRGKTVEKLLVMPRQPHQGGGTAQRALAPASGSRPRARQPNSALLQRAAGVAGALRLLTRRAWAPGTARSSRCPCCTARRARRVVVIAQCITCKLASAAAQHQQQQQKRACIHAAGQAGPEAPQPVQLSALAPPRWCGRRRRSRSRRWT